MPALRIATAGAALLVLTAGSTIAQPTGTATSKPISILKILAPSDNAKIKPHGHRLGMATWRTHAVAAHQKTRHLLAVAPAAALALLGTAAGDLLRVGRAKETVKTGALAAAGAALALGGWLWGQTLPLNKDLWTPTFVLFAGGLGLLLLAACHVLFDVVRLRPLGVPFAVLGSNAIVGYVASALFAIGAMQTWPDPRARGHTLSLHTVVLDPLGGAVGPVAAGWIYTASVIVVWWLVLFALYRRRVFIRV